MEEEVPVLPEKKRGRKKQEGFFEKEDKPKKVRKLSEPKKSKEYNCNLCCLWEKVNSPKMKYTGEGELKTLILAESAGAEEDKTGIQLVGKAGKFLRTHLRTNGYDLDRDFYKSNAVRCRCLTPDMLSNRPPTDLEIKCCKQNWQKEVEELQPTHIFLMGESAVKAFFGERGKKIKENLSISRWRKLCIPDPWSKAWVTSLFHPAFILRNPDAEHVFARDLKWALGNLKRKPPEFPDWQSKVEAIMDYREVIQFISGLYREPAIAIDYETNRLRPYAQGSEVVSVGVGLSERGYAFPMTHPESGWSSWEMEEVRTCWADFIRNYSGKFLVHNHQMERIWTKRFFKTDSQNWHWDSMVVAHILDERQKYTSLDFQIFIHWGFEYGAEIEPYKQSVDKEDDESFNRMKEAPLLSLLQYGGLDGFFQYKLWDQQVQDLERQPSLQPAVGLFLAGIKRFADMEDIGIQVDKKYYQWADRDLETRIGNLEWEVENSEEAQLFEEKTGKPLKWSSTTKDLPTLIYDILGNEAKVFTPKGKPSANKEVIQEIKGEFFENLRMIRKLRKLKNTHLKGFLKSYNGKLHPSLTLHIARSLRSSGQNPNLQNLDQHDEESMQLIRGGIIPSSGRMIGATDYGSHEVRIIDCLSRDKQLEKDLLNGIDFHKHFGDRLGVSRYDGKNSFVFAEFYGSYYKSIWEDLISKGYVNLEMELVREVEKEFWERYHGVREWQNKMVHDYEKTGYIEFPWGFRNRGLLTRNMIFNRPVQGAAFHCLLWSIIKTFERKEERKWESDLIFEIHDEILFSMVSEEKEEIKKEVTKIMTEEIREENTWITVPLINEWSFTGIDEPWTEIKKDE